MIPIKDTNATGWHWEQTKSSLINNQIKKKKKKKWKKERKKEENKTTKPNQKLKKNTNQIFQVVLLKGYIYKHIRVGCCHTVEIYTIFSVHTVYIYSNNLEWKKKKDVDGGENEGVQQQITWYVTYTIHICYSFTDTPGC